MKFSRIFNEERNIVDAMLNKNSIVYVGELVQDLNSKGKKRKFTFYVVDKKKNHKEGSSSMGPGSGYSVFVIEGDKKESFFKGGALGSCKTNSEIEKEIKSIIKKYIQVSKGIWNNNFYEKFKGLDIPDINIDWENFKSW